MYRFIPNHEPIIHSGEAEKDICHILDAMMDRGAMFQDNCQQIVTAYSAGLITRDNCNDVELGRYAVTVIAPVEPGDVGCIQVNCIVTNKKGDKVDGALLQMSHHDYCFIISTSNTYRYLVLQSDKAAADISAI